MQLPVALCNKFATVILMLLHMLTDIVAAELSCHHCRGINCLRTSYEATQKCLNEWDICANVYDGQTLLAQGCWEQFDEELRKKCDAAQTARVLESSECFKCNENMCNNYSSSSFECVQCDSDDDDNCLANAQSLKPLRCGISRTPNEYCFVKQEAKRVIRGCSYTLEEQVSCFSSPDCMICQPSELSRCNNIEVAFNDSGSGDSDIDNDGSNGDKNATNSGTEQGSEGDGSGDGDSEGGNSQEIDPNGDGSDQGNNENNGSGGEEVLVDGGTECSTNAEGSCDNTQDQSSGAGDGESEGGSNICSTNVINSSILVYIIIAFFIIK